MSGFVPAALCDLVIASCETFGYWVLIPCAAALAWAACRVVMPRGLR